MEQQFTPDNNDHTLIKRRLLSQIYSAYESGDKDTFDYASSLFDEIFRGEGYEIPHEFIDDEAENYTSNIRIVKKIGKKAVRQVQSGKKYPLGERVTQKGNIIYCDKLKIGFRYDQDTSNADRYDAHLHLFRTSSEDFHIIATLTDNDQYDENVEGSEEYLVFLEPHNGDQSTRTKAAKTIDSFGKKRRRLIKAVTENYLGRLDSDNRRKPSQDGSAKLVL